MPGCERQEKSDYNYALLGYYAASCGNYNTTPRISQKSADLINIAVEA
jgi:hypothetical protein